MAENTEDDWKETVREIYDEILRQRNPPASLIQIQDIIQERHWDFFCKPIPFEDFKEEDYE